MVSTQQALEDLVQRAAESWQEPGAPRILVLPPEVRIEELPAASQGEPKGVPIGLEEFRLSPQYIDLVNTDPHFIALGDKEAGKTTLLRTWIRGLQQRYTPEQAQIVLVDVRRGLLEFNRSPHMLAYAYTTEKVKEAVAQIKDELAKRVEANLSQPIELLRNPQPWSGLHYYIFLDDYEEIAGPMPQSGNPLNELEGFLQSGREIGFHIVLARRLTDFARSNYDPIFRGIKTMECPGLLMRGDPAEGRQALHKMTVSDKLPNGRGYLVRRGYPPTLVQVAKSEG